MKIHTETLKLETKREFEFTNITKKIEKIVKKSKVKEGFVNLFSKHTTLSLEINEDEKLLHKDIKWLMKRIAPDKRNYFHDKIKLRKGCPPDEPKNGKGHLRCMLLETSQMIPILNGKMALGKWQRIFAVETSGPRPREIIIQVCGKENHRKRGKKTERRKK